MGEHTAIRIERTGPIWLDGRLVPWDQAQVHVATHALHYGSSVFEGLRAYATPSGSAVLGLREHVDRLLDSCRIVEMPVPYDAGELGAAILKTVRASGQAACYVRPLVFRGAGSLGIDPSHCPVTVAIAAIPHGPHFGPDAATQGVDVGVSSWRRLAPATNPVLAKAAANYLSSQLMVLEAKRHGYHEAIALDVDGYACEGSGMNLFAILDGELLTPPRSASILSGVTRRFVMQLARDLDVPCAEQRLAREMLHIAHELFFTGTAAEITPIRSVDRQPVGSGTRGPLTERLQRAFLAIAHGEAEDRHGWLTPVDP